MRTRKEIDETLDSVYKSVDLIIEKYRYNEQFNMVFQRLLDNKKQLDELIESRHKMQDVEYLVKTVEVISHVRRDVLSGLGDIIKEERNKSI